MESRRVVSPQAHGAAAVQPRYSQRQSLAGQRPGARGLDRADGRHRPQQKRQPRPLGLLQRPRNLLRQHHRYREQTMKIKTQLLSVSLCLCGCICIPAHAEDVTMFGGTPTRNMVNNQKNPPTQWDVEKGTNIKWTAELGSKSYAGPIVAEGMVIIGTNNEGQKDPKEVGDRGVLMAFKEAGGDFLWQKAYQKLPT